MPKKKTSYEHDVCLSFAGENRRYVKAVAKELKALGVRVFYDKYETTRLWGKDLYTHLDEVYSRAARYCVIFVSKAYKNRLWTNHERQSAQARAFREHEEYILPARFDDTKIPGIRDTIGYVDLREHKARAFAHLVARKVGGERHDYLPEFPDLMLASMAELYESVDPVLAIERAKHLLKALTKTSAREREVLIRLFQNACSASDLPRSVHVNLDLLARAVGVSESECIRLLRRLRSLGFYTKTHKQKPDKQHLGEDNIVILEWQDMSDDTAGNGTDVASTMLQTCDFSHCDECGVKALRRLDFAHLSSGVHADIADAESGKKVTLRQEFPLRFRHTGRKKARSTRATVRRTTSST